MNQITRKVATFNLPTKFGNFETTGFEVHSPKEKYALTLIKRPFKDNIPFVRMHSECLFSETLGSQLCDCAEQLHEAQKIIQEKGGILIYLNQEGRGHGLLPKLHEYELMQQGYDTVEASIKAGFEPDERDYTSAVEILREFKIKELYLLTNNPRKIKFLEDNGFIVHRTPLKIKPNLHNTQYIQTKKLKLSHLI